MKNVVFDKIIPKDILGEQVREVFLPLRPSRPIERAFH